MLFGAAMTAMPARAAVDPLRQRLRLTVAGGLASAATCVSFADPAEGGPNGGVLRLRGVPSCGKVDRALLYWSILSDVVPADTLSPRLGGMPIVPEAIGEVFE